MTNVQTIQGKKEKKREEYADIVVIGGGASGLMAAIHAARASGGARVLVLDHKEKLGKKLYATGNGKCNFTNERALLDEKALPGESEVFFGDPALLYSVLGQFDRDDTLAFFHEIGILPKCRNGYYYPNSRTASSVVRALEHELNRLDILSRMGTAVTEIKPGKEGGFLLCTSGGVISAAQLIIATGLLASPKLGSDGSAMAVIKALGHRFTPIVPALCGFFAEGLDFKRSAGVRAEARIRLYVDEKAVAEETGELQFTDYGISGIPVFQVSRHASLALYEKRPVQADLDFFPEIDRASLEEDLFRRFCGDWIKKRSAADQMNGLVHDKLIPVLLAKAGIGRGALADSLEKDQICRLAKVCKGAHIRLTAPRGFEQAQVCAGGIRPVEVDPVTLESRLHGGLFFCGEVLDVDGICGGYNLQWAWSSGAVAGRSAANKFLS